jgi:asparagine synthase (glutamine-hydrolysing)
LSADDAVWSWIAGSGRRCFARPSFRKLETKPMCGIVGLIGEPDPALAEQRVRRMSEAIARRGPDDEGFEAWDGAALGHRRLSIYDLSPAGHQPMVSTDRSTGIVFNGSIYNFPELRRELEAQHHKFTSNTDTEVLLKGYCQWGIGALVGRLRGMFAFAIWDDRRKKLFLVRDRLGVKPLVYALRGGRLAFGSSVAALRAGGFAGDIDPQAMAEYLEFGYVTEERTIYQGVAKVPQAAIVEFSNGRLRRQDYWSPPEAGAAGPASFEEAVEETERLFLRAVERRLFADVPVGSLLSGGVDSSLVCWAIAKLGGDVTAFTVGTPGDPWDETPDAIETARQLGIEHRVLTAGAEEPCAVDEMVSAYGEPFACASALGMLKLSRAMKNSVTVMLTGDGGDDVFLGYPEHLYLWRSQTLARRLPEAAAPLWSAARAAIPKVGVLRRGVHFLDYSTGGLGALTCGREGLPEYVSDGLLGERLQGAAIGARQIPWSAAAARRVLTEFLAFDHKTRFVGEYLTKVDGATMRFALEARSPFLDQDLWEFAAALPYALRLRRGVLKAMLREIARRRIGPRVATGKKRGFGIPVQRWIAGPWSDAVEARFRDSLLAREGWIRAEPVQRLLQKSKQAGRAPNRLWYLFVLEAWMKQQQVSSA